MQRLNHDCLGTTFKLRCLSSLPVEGRSQPASSWQRPRQAPPPGSVPCAPYPMGASPVHLPISDILCCIEVDTLWKVCLSSAEEHWLLFLQAVTLLAGQLRFQHEFWGDTDIQTIAVPHKLNINSIWPSNSALRYTLIQSSHSNKFVYTDVHCSTIRHSLKVETTQASIIRWTDT